MSRGVYCESKEEARQGKKVTCSLTIWSAAGSAAINEDDFLLSIIKDIRRSDHDSYNHVWQM